MRRIIAVLLGALLLAALFPMTLRIASADTVSGNIGNLYWQLDSDAGTLVITGSGDMVLSSVYSPWFEYRKSIKSVSFPSGLTSIGVYAFNGCTNLQSITIPESVTKIERGAFRDCDSLTSVSIPNGVKSIDGEAFSYCDSLTSVTIPSSVTDMGENPFGGCPKLTTISVSSQNKSFRSVNGVLFNYDKTVVLAYPSGKQESTYTIPNTVTSIGENSFVECYNLTSITIPNTVKSIGNNAFESCPLTSVTIPSSVTKIGDNPFDDCWLLTTIQVSSQNNYFCAVDGVLFNHDMTILVAYPGGKQESSYQIPDGVKRINAFAFCGCYQHLTSITIPNSTTEIGSFAFFQCDALSSIVIPIGVTAIKDHSFFACTSLESVTFANSVTNIGFQAFDYCDTLQDVYFLGSPAEKEQITIADRNEPLKNAAWRYLIVEQPTSATVASGEKAQFAVITNGAKSFQWQYSKDNGATWTDWSGKTSGIVTVTGSATNNGCLYRCVITNEQGSIKSAKARLTVSNVKPMILTQPKAATVASGKSVTFKVVAGGTGKTYQWQYSKNNGASWTNWSGKTSASLNVTASATNNGCLYRCVVKNSYGSVTSAKARLTVSGVKPMILTQPSSTTIAVGHTGTIKVVAAGTGLSYQWQYSKNNGASWANWSGKTSASLTITASATNNGCLYRCVVKNTKGSVTTSQARLTVLCAKPNILVQPANQNIPSGKIATFKVVAWGDGDLQYQWQWSNDGKTWKNCTSYGYNTSTFSFKSSTGLSGRQYRCVVKNSNGSVNSSAAKFTVK